MNCKPGDLARVISIPQTRGTGLDDVIIKVTHLDGVTDDGTLPAWAYEGPKLTHRKGPTVGRVVTAIADHVLRPIRDPGEDAVDEMLLRIPSPSEPVTC